MSLSMIHSISTALLFFLPPPSRKFRPKRIHFGFGCSSHHHASSMRIIHQRLDPPLPRIESEKATMEMESSQYRRMIEEKFAYDEEEMEILKEIIVRREKEKHVLEKEVETYRQMISGEMTVKKHDPSLDCSDDPTKLLKTIYESIRKKEKLDGKMRSADDGEGIHQLEFTDPRDEFNLEVQEKGMLTMEIYPSCGQCKSSSIGEDDVRFDSNKFQELGFCKDNSCSILGEDAEKDGKIEVGIPVENLDVEDRQDGDMRDSNSSYFETDSNVLDVHVIDDGQNLADVRIGKASGASQTGNLFELFGKGGVTDESSNTSEFVTSIEVPVASPAGVGGDIRRSCSDMPKGARCWIPQVTEFLSIYGGVPCLQLITRALHLQLKSRSYGKGSRPSSKVEKFERSPGASGKGNLSVGTTRGNILSTKRDQENNRSWKRHTPCFFTSFIIQGYFEEKALSQCLFGLT
ncbi:uncharacterized protein M6B38_132825 [Iris pallida]|uniref:GTD-binding domain-containing protein n=1 Tax=Iris pallida TaxID=29817 RepID=A0AAX6FHI3_IRIPA|nr:uncharacterized protein M6B38_132825 [Iris pallida]